MDIKDICSAGGDILDAVADAVNRNDYTGLSANVSNTVNRVVDQVKAEASKGTYGKPTHQYGRTSYTRKGQADYKSIHDEGDGRYASIYRKKMQDKNLHSRSADSRSVGGRAPRVQAVQLPAAATKHPAGRISGPIQLAWGILAASGFGITALVMGIMLVVEGGSAYLVMSLVFGLLTALGVTDIVRGSRKIGLVNRFYRYARLIGARGYIAVEELAFQTGQHKDNVLRDLKKMMKKHMFLQGRLDHAQTTFMITQEAYQQYLQAENSRRSMEAQQGQYGPGAGGQAGAYGANAGNGAAGAYGADQGSGRAGAYGANAGNGAAGAYGTSQRWAQEGQGGPGAGGRQAAGAGGAGAHAYDAKTRKILNDGNAYIRMVHECNEKMRNEEMSYKLSKLEAIMRRIFEQVERDPSSADDLHKFMDYYLPTTTKLLHAYIDLDRQEIAGENISATKKEIEDTLDTINIAFEKLLDGLFEDTAWDISSDISVMKTMMAQEGLTGTKDFDI